MVICYNRNRLKTEVIFAFKISNKTERSAKVFRATTKRELVDLKTFWKGNSLTWRRCPTPRRRCKIEVCCLSKQTNMCDNILRAQNAKVSISVSKIRRKLKSHFDSTLLQKRIKKRKKSNSIFLLFSNSTFSK